MKRLSPIEYRAQFLKAA
ncbi:hypothetical protein V5094_01610 [Moellerella wisconsensis]